MALYKRGKTWWMSFEYNAKHVQKTTKCTNKRDAETIERAYRTQLAKREVGIETKLSAPLFSAAIKEFFDWAEVEHRAKPNTLRSYKARSLALKDFFGDIQIDEIEAGDVEKFKQYRSKHNPRPRSDPKAKREIKVIKEKGKDKKKGEKPKAKSTTLKPATINRELALLKIFFNYFIKKDAVVKNPVSRVKFLKEDNTQIRVVSNEEESLYLMAASQPLQDFATIMVDTGMRPEEVARIERKNVYFERNYLFVPYGKTKAAKRKIPLTSRVYQILNKRLSGSTSDYAFETKTTG